ncbi:MAG: carboxymuconolactone decarboxylase family protein [Phycisphaeraceae bacterium]|nr:carboxymuconolactone decarboxylase family protein [Phycisphaerales bacterium]MCB9842215.1 carboxymuconolactone decarboxylase family protein [Phycisphaeraceae bacterium]
MPRLSTVDPANATGRARELFDGPLHGKHFNIFKGMANSPAALDAYLAFSGALGKGSLTAGEREAIALAVGEANQCDYCLAAHTALAKGAGLPDAHALGARRGAVKDAQKLDALVKFALRLHEKKGAVSDEDLKTFKAAGYTDAHAAEVVANYALNVYTNYFNHLNQTSVDFPAAGKI